MLVIATDVFSKGGIQRYIRYQLKALREAGIFERVWSMSLVGKNEDDHFEGEEEAVDYVGGGIGLFSKARFFWKAIFLVKRKNIGMVICNHVGFAPMAYLIKKLFKVPYGINVYGLEIWTGLGWMEAAALKKANFIIGDCNFILDYLNKNLGIARDKLFLLYDCVDTAVFKKEPVPDDVYRKYGIPKDKKIITTIGRMVYDKGQETMIRLLGSLPEDVVYVLIGGGPRLEEWRGLAKDLGVADRVVFTGRVPEEDLMCMYNIGDLSIYLSEFKPHEGGGLPLVLIEASSCGKPIISSNEDGAAEAVVDGKNGYLVEPRNEEMIVQKIRAILYSRNLKELMGEYGRKYCEEHFSYPVFRDEQERILKQVLERNKS